MAESGTTGLSRVTIVTPRSRVDVGLPSDVPVAELLPSVLALTGADDLDPPAGWSVRRPTGEPLEIGRSLAVIGVRDGELLYLHPAGQDVPEPVFDDVADAIATVALSRPGRWTGPVTRVAGSVTGSLALTGGAAVLLFAGRSDGLAVFLAFAVACVLTSVTILTSRSVLTDEVAAALTLSASAYGFVAGLLLAGDDGFAVAHLLLGAVAVMVFSAFGLAGVDSPAVTVVSSGSVTVAAGLLLGALLDAATGAGPGGVAAVEAGLALASLTVVPLVAIRLGRVPVPPISLDAEEPAADEEIRAADVTAGVARAESLLAGSLIGVSAVAAGAAVVQAHAGSPPAYALAVVTGLLLLSRARSFGRVDQRLPLLLGGLVAVGAVGWAAFARGAVDVRLGVVFTALHVLAVTALVLAVRGPRRGSPLWGRVIDLAEVLLALAVVPLIVWTSGLFDWARSLSL